MLKSFPTQPNNDDLYFDLVDSEVRVACGYNFCNKSQLSTNSQSEKQIPLPQNMQPPNYQKLMEMAYEEHKIDEAYKYALLLEESEKQVTPQQQHRINGIKMEMKDVTFFQEKIYQSGWKLQTKKKNLTVSSKYEGQTVGVLVEAQLDLEIQKFLTVMTEIDLMQEFMPFMAESRTEKIISRNNKLGYCVNDFPILAKREAFFQGVGYDRMNHNQTILLYSRTLDSRPDLQKLFDYQVKPTPGAILLDYKYLVLQCKPNSPHSGSIKLATNVDIKISLPMFLLAAASESFGLDFYKNMLKIARKFEGSEWQKKVKENPAFFEFIRKRIGQHFID